MGMRKNNNFYLIIYSVQNYIYFARVLRKTKLNMTCENVTVGVYGIQDVNLSNIPTLSHDHGLTVIQNGQIICSIQLERLNRLKHSCAMPDMLFSLLKEKQWLNTSLNFVFTDNILGRSFINKEGNIRFEAPLTNQLTNKTESGNLWFLDKNASALVLNHELAHIGSCLPFYGNFKDNSLLIHFDGSASKSNFSAWYYKDQKLNHIESGWSLKWLSSLYNANALVFWLTESKPVDLNSVAGKFMGYAALGTYSEDIANWLKSNNFFENCWKNKKEFFDAIKSTFGIHLKHLDQHNVFLQNIAATIQQIFVKTALQKFECLKIKTQADYLYYAGGSALNILLNTQIVESNLFKNVFIPPCCNDSGLSVGAAAFAEWEKGQNFSAHLPYINNWGIEDYNVNYSPADIEQVATLLINKKVIAICNGFAESGPRALGNRSIIALASDKKLAQKVSVMHKKREWYRPVAPIMLEKNTKYFTGKPTIHHLSGYMLLDFKILDDKKQELEGTVHADGTARIQTIFDKYDNPFMYDLLRYLDEKHQVRALINTSFNTKGEPIVHTIYDAINSAKNMNLDGVVLNGKLQEL